MISNYWVRTMWIHYDVIRWNIIRVTDHLSGVPPVRGEFQAQRPVTRSFDVLCDLHLNKRLSKQSWGWWFETLSRPLWRYCNVSMFYNIVNNTRVAHVDFTIGNYRWFPTQNATVLISDLLTSVDNLLCQKTIMVKLWKYTRVFKRKSSMVWFMYLSIYL